MEEIKLKELVETYTSSMNEVSRRFTMLMNENIHEDLTYDQFCTLRYIRINQPCTSSDIAQEFSIGKSAVTAQVNRLFEKGIVQRKQDEEDRRVIFLVLTVAGDTIMEKANEKLHEILGDILKEFSEDEVESFIGSLQKLVSILREREIEGD